MPYRFDPDLRKIMKSLGSELSSSIGISALLAVIDKNAEKDFLVEIKRHFADSDKISEVRSSLPSISKIKSVNAAPVLRKKTSLMVPPKSTLAIE